MKNVFLFLFYCVIFRNFIKSDIISFDINYYDSNIPYTQIYFPLHDYFYSIYFNTYLPFTVFYFNLIDHTDKKNHKENTTLYLEGKYEAFKYIIDDIQFDHLHSNNLPIYISINYLLQRDFGISLRFRYQDESFSLIHNLYNTNAIDKLQFAFYNTKRGLQSKFFLGGIPHNDHLKFKYKGTLKVSGDNQFWSFGLKSITFHNQKYNINIPTMVHSTIKYMFISDDVYNTLIGNIFNNEISKNLCNQNTTTYLSDRSKQNYIYCKKNMDVLNEDIVFDFDNTQITFKIKELFDFENGQDTIDSSFLSNGSPDKFYGFSGVILGMKFLDLFNYTIFDYENKQIEIYSDSFQIIHNNNILQKILIISILLCIINIILIIYIKINLVLSKSNGSRHKQFISYLMY